MIMIKRYRWIYLFVFFIALFSFFFINSSDDNTENVLFEALKHKNAVSTIILPDSLEFFADMVVDTSVPKPDLHFGEPPALQFTDQGVPFFLGSIHNPSSDWLWASGLLVLEKQGELIGVAQITPPLPLPPGGARPFSVQQFWGISAEILTSEDAMSTLEVHATVEGIATLPQDESVVQLELNILQYEVLGSLVFLRGLITNPSEAIIREPS